MSATFREDDSFFTYVLPPCTLYGSTIFHWFESNGASAFRLIRDNEVETSFMNLEQVDELYPGVKTFSIVVNPWARMRYAYLMLCELKVFAGHPLIDAFNFKAETFEQFILNLPNIQPTDTFWFTPTTPISKWLEYEADGNLRKVDYILKAETLDDDFKPIKDFFCSERPLELRRAIPDYREYYTEEMRQVVAELFKEDIERFDYKF